MSDVPVHTEPPIAAVTVVYQGPVAPHWDVRADFGDKAVVDEFFRRLNARLMLVPPHDPQFRRNRERVIRDAERENIVLAWDPPELADSYLSR
ncbi:MAG: hypothetical protein R2698_06660 [Microthrixaceae bacterium]